MRYTLLLSLLLQPSSRGRLEHSDLAVCVWTGVPGAVVRQTGDALELRSGQKSAGLLGLVLVSREGERALVEASVLWSRAKPFCPGSGLDERKDAPCLSFSRFQLVFSIFIPYPSFLILIVMLIASLVKQISSMRKITLGRYEHSPLVRMVGFSPAAAYTPISRCTKCDG